MVQNIPVNKVGRPPGIPNKITQLVRETFEKHNHNPIAELIRIASNPELPDKLRIDCNKELAKYYAPQLRAVEHTGKDGESLAANINVNFGKTDES